MALSAVQLSLAKKLESALTGFSHIRSLLIAHFYNTFNNILNSDSIYFIICISAIL